MSAAHTTGMAEEGLDENVPCEESGTLEPSNVNGNGEAAQQSPTVQNDEDDDKGDIFIFNNYCHATLSFLFLCSLD